MSEQRCSVTAHLQPRSNTAALMRIVSILHSRGAEVHELAFDTRGGEVATMTALVTLGNVGWKTLRSSLLHPLEVIDVDARPCGDEASSATAYGAEPVEQRGSIARGQLMVGVGSTEVHHG